MPETLLTRAGRVLYGDGFIPSLADALDVNERTVQRWASGKAYPPRGVWVDLAVLLEWHPLAKEIKDLMANERTFSSEELRNARKAFAALLRDTWDGDWTFWRRDRPNENRKLLESMDLWPKDDE